MSNLDIDPELVRKLAALLKETGLNEIEYAEGDKRIRVSAGIAAQPTYVQVGAAPSPSHLPANSSPVEIIKPEISGTPVDSPMVGTVYLAPEPGKPPFVNVGDIVKQGDTLLIIEAMKVMNPIKATKGGKILDIHVSDAQPVEFGETLMVIS